MSVLASLKTSRNIILDLLRGYYLLVILVDHLSFKFYPSVYEYLNGYGNLWVSAAEGFIFMSGLLVGMVYVPKVRALGFANVALKLLKRSFQLFSYHIVLTLFFTALALKLGNWPYLSGGLMTEPFRQIIKATLNLQYNYGWADVLVLYAVFMFFAPVLLYFIEKRLVLIPLTFSFLLWLYSFKTEQVYNSALSSFEMLSWQFLFYIGIVSGTYKDKIISIYQKHRKLINSVVITVFITTLIGSILDNYYGFFSEASKQLIDKLFVKSTLGPGRFLVFLCWFSFFYLIFDKIQKYLIKIFGWLLLTYGQKSLVTYIVQSFLLYFIYYYPSTGNRLENFAITTVSVVAVWGVVKLVIYANRLYADVKIPGSAASEI